MSTATSPIALGRAQTRRRGKAPFENMMWIPSGTFMMGSNNHYPEEAPAHPVTVDGFWMDQHTVTNAQFPRFVEDTNYMTSAERAPRAEDYPGANRKCLCLLPSCLFARVMRLICGIISTGGRNCTDCNRAELDRHWPASAIAVIRTFLNYFLERDVERYGEEQSV